MNVVSFAAAIALIAGAPASEQATSPNEPVESASTAADAVRKADAAFWHAYNRCDAIAMEQGFTAEAEFYHDKTGLTVTRSAIVKSIMDGPCASPATLQLRREVVVGSERYFPLAGGFAMLSGEQRFLSIAKGGPAKQNGIARFVEIWQSTPQGWQMRRVLSYDHRPDVPQLTPVMVSQEHLTTLTGIYASDPSGPMQVCLESGTLTVKSGKAVFELVPLAEGLFGTPGRWLTFTFDGPRLVVREDGDIVATGFKKTSVKAK